MKNENAKNENEKKYPKKTQKGRTGCSWSLW
jgi:hypothetical protein